MRIDIATLFTQMCGSVLNESIVGRGIRNGFIEVHTYDIRNTPKTSTAALTTSPTAAAPECSCRLSRFTTAFPR